MEDNGSKIGFFGLLTIVFITLKLLKVINWSWWWVLGPMWIPLPVGMVIALVALIAAKLLGRRR